jgi:hypothetical protein
MGATSASKKKNVDKTPAAKGPPGIPAAPEKESSKIVNKSSITNLQETPNPFKMLLQRKKEVQKSEESSNSDVAVVISPEKTQNFDKYGVKPRVLSSKSYGSKEFGIYVAVIKNECLAFRVDNLKVQRALNSVIWKVLNNEELEPLERKLMKQLCQWGLEVRTFAWMEGNEVQKTWNKQQVKLFFLLMDETDKMTKDQLYEFFCDFCTDILDQLSVCLEENIKTVCDKETFLWNPNATYEELIGTDRALSRFKYEVQDMQQCRDPAKYFEDNKELIFKYFRPGNWSIDVALTFQPDNYENLLSKEAYKTLCDMDVLPPSGNKLQRELAKEYDDAKDGQEK